MRLLLDTHTIIWHIGRQESLSEAASAAIENTANQIHISSASLREMAIKNSLGKLTLRHPIRTIVTTYQDAGAIILPISADHALATENLPWHHRDPFDRILIAHALCEDLILVSRDNLFSYYEIKIIW
jgi:PIN domain nuclease of toxin-antitoxin system